MGSIRVLYYEHPGAGLGGSRRSLLNLILGLGDCVQAFICGHLPDDVMADLPPTSMVLPVPPGWPLQDETRYSRAGKTVRWWCHFVGAVIRLMREIKHHNIELVHANNDVTSNAPAILAAWLTRRPCVCHLRGTVPAWRETRWLYRHVDHYIAISEHVRSYYAEQRLLYGTAVSVVYNGLDVAELSRKARRGPFPNGSRARIGLIGRPIEHKGHDYFLETAAEVQKTRPDVKFAIWGPIPNAGEADRSYYEALCEKRRALGIEESVQFIGPYADVAEAMHKTDVLLCCSPYDNFSRTFFEAMACGVPVVAFDVGGVREVAVPGENCLLVPNRDAREMAVSVLRLLDDAALRERLRAGGQRTVERCFDREANAHAVLGIYRNLVAKRR